MTIHSFTFNPFQENTYVLSDESKQCIIVDPGCYDAREKAALAEYVESQGLVPVRLVNTHAHIDHILGNNFVAGRYHLGLEMHEADVDILRAAPVYGQMWGVNCEPSPEPSLLLKEGDIVAFGHTKLKVFYTPGHSPGSVCLYAEEEGILVAGDVLFYESIGRTDLPGGDYEELIQSIREKLFVLPDNVQVWPGHGPSTTIGHERQHNPFVGARSAAPFS